MLEVSPSHSESVSATLWRGGLPWFDLGSLGIPCKEQSKNIESTVEETFLHTADSKHRYYRADYKV